MLYYYNSNRMEMHVQWSGKNGETLYYQLLPGKLKPKGSRAWVLKAIVCGNPPQRTLTVRHSKYRIPLINRALKKL